MKPVSNFLTPPPRRSAESKVKRPKTGNKGFFASQYKASFAVMPASILSIGALKGMKKVSQLNHEDTVMLRKAAQEGLKESGLYDKGVRAYRMHEVRTPKLKDILKNPSAFKKATEKKLNNLSDAFKDLGNAETIDPKAMINKVFDAVSPVKYNRSDEKALGALQEEVAAAMNKKMDKMAKRMGKFLPEDAIAEMKEGTSGIMNTMSRLFAKMQGFVFKQGSNACYLPKANKIITPDKSLQTSIFHEMGHALNNNGGMLMKALQKARPAATILPGIILTAALLNKRKVNDEQLPTDSKLQRLKDGIKRNAGKLTALAMLPMVAEEGIASLRGGKIAKNLFNDGKLSKELLNKVKLTNLGGFSTYVLALATTVVMTKLAIKFKDDIQAKHEAKAEAKYQEKLDKYNQKIAAKEAKRAHKTTYNTTQA